jgi:hypothetical protein
MYAHDEGDLSARFGSKNFKINIQNHNEILSYFVEEFIFGRRVIGRSDQFDVFSVVLEEGRMRWPLGYVVCILKLFVKFKPCVSPIIECMKKLEVYASQTDSGKDWETIIEIALLFRFLSNRLNGDNVPFNLLSIGGKNPKQAEKLDYISIPGDIKNLNEAQNFIEAEINKCTQATLILFSPLHNSFPVFDGFAAFTECDKDGKRSTVISGYQAKKGSDAPKTSVPDWINGGGWLIQGQAAITQRKDNKGWIYMSENEICENILGFSLAIIYPAVALW